MRTFVIAFVFAFLLALSPVHSFVDASSYEAIIDVGSKHNTESILLNFTSSDESEFVMRISPNPQNIEILLDGSKSECILENNVGGAFISCPISDGVHILKINYTTSYSLIDLDGRMLVTTSYVPDFNSDLVLLKIQLPSDAVVESISEDISPAANRIYSDGSRILLLWELNNPTEQFNAAVIFSSGRALSAWISVAAILLSIMVIAFVLRKHLHLHLMNIFGKKSKEGTD